MRKIATTLVVALSLSLGCRTGEIVADSQALDDGRRWLDPRTIPAPTAPVLLRAAAANARNQTAVSERLLLDVVQKQPASESARRAPRSHLWHRRRSRRAPSCSRDDAAEPCDGRALLCR
ncbi:MAG TPA: hypothetical protein VHI99_13595, partial [Vicinamibacterales bacterium]|nr:hypothetical protein [Vicinamibacterales bacterium]